jgi:aspartate racemase
MPKASLSLRASREASKVSPQPATGSRQCAPGGKLREANVRTIGILGGMSNQATAEYYRMINDAVNARLGGWNTAEVIISSVNFANIERFARNDLWDEAGRYLAAKAIGLERAGAEMLLCASNTMHRVADAFMQDLTIPFLHIADPTGEAINRAGLQRVALIGTKSTMVSDTLKRRFAQEFGVEIMVPNEADQAMIDRVIFDELVKRRLHPDSKAAYLDAVDRLNADGAEGVILGCTEIFLLIAQADRPDLPFFDTTVLHVERAVAWSLEEA